MRASLLTMLVLSLSAAGAVIVAHGAQHAADEPPGRIESRFPTSVTDGTANVTFVADRAANRLIAADARDGHPVKTFANMRAMQALVDVPELHRLYVATADTLDVAAIDTRTLAFVARTQAGRYPTSMTWDARDRKLFVSDELGEALVVIDGGSSARTAMVPLGGEAGDAVYDAAERVVYVNVSTRGELAAVDAASDTVVARYPLAGCPSNLGLVLEAASRRMRVACAGNGATVTFDLRTHRQLAHS